MTKSMSAEDKKLFSYLRIFLLPTLILKAAIIYFGLHYSQDPGAGYGWGLVAAIALSLANFAYFIYVNWNDDSEEPSRK